MVKPFKFRRIINWILGGPLRSRIEGPLMPNEE